MAPASSLMKACAVLALLGAVARGQQSSPDVTAMVSAASDLGRRGQYDEAVLKLREAYAIAPQDMEVSMNFALFLAKTGDEFGARKLFTNVIRNIVRHGDPAVSFAVSMKGGQKRYNTKTRKEKTQFAKQLKGREEIADAFAKALKELRELEHVEEWLVNYAIECVHVFGVASDDDTNGAYGIIWYQGWAKVMERPALKEILRPSYNAVVLGSGLGEQCLFFAAHGLHCTGYDIVCDSLVKQSKKFVGKLPGPATVSVHCEDAGKAKLSDAAVVWVNDKLWNSRLRNDAFRNAQSQMSSSSVLVSFHPPRPDSRFEEVDQATVPTSWEEKQTVYVLKLKNSAEL